VNLARAGRKTEQSLVGYESSEHHEQQRSVVEREDAKRAADVEVFEPACRAMRVPKNARDQETGENEEERDTAPSGFQQQPDALDQEVARLRASAGVVGDDDQNRQPADAIQCRQMFVALHSKVSCTVFRVAIAIKRSSSKSNTAPNPLTCWEPLPALAAAT
jgi:hypothetical protein